MATLTQTTETAVPVHLSANTDRQPLKVSGALDAFEHFDVTPVIGREYPNVNIVDDLINAENADQLLRDLAITISERGVVFFRAQANLTDDQHKWVNQRLGELVGKPKESSLHIHPLLNGTNEFGVSDNEISVISSQGFKAFGRQPKDRDDRKGGAASWHSDIQFEPFPADYTSLRLTQLPKTGGDTLWASGYELYDRYSDPYRTFFEGLTATFSGEGFIQAAKARPDLHQLHTDPRGHPANIGSDLKAVHPVVRTNPVTGWKSIYAIGNFPKRINELSERESNELLASFIRRIEENHDLQVRMRWRNENDIAFWDNRSVFHSATNDYDNLGDRVGHRAVGIGERPFFDSKSKSRTADLTRQ